MYCNATAHAKRKTAARPNKLNNANLFARPFQNSKASWAARPLPSAPWGAPVLAQCAARGASLGRTSGPTAWSPSGLHPPPPPPPPHPSPSVPPPPHPTSQPAPTSTPPPNPSPTRPPSTSPPPPPSARTTTTTTTTTTMKDRGSRFGRPYGSASEPP